MTSDASVYTGDRVKQKLVSKIISDRPSVENPKNEEYLVKWKGGPPGYPPLSWQTADELSSCLPLLQEYVESLAHLLHAHRKRKNLLEHEARLSPLVRNRQTSVSSASVSTTSHDDLTQLASHDVFNGTRECPYGFISVQAESNNLVPRLHIDSIPPPQFPQNQGRKADNNIRKEFMRRLEGYNKDKKNTPMVKLTNTVDRSSPSLRFEFIHESTLGKGVIKADEDFMTGCTQCSPHMGANVGCEYTKKCECLEYAQVDIKRLSEEQRSMYENNPTMSTIGWPKRFPYFSSNEKRGCLVNTYLESRWPVYECNKRCPCGDICKTRVVQHGRRVPLEIFKTKNRGWGLRCTVSLQKGQFIDTYLGEIITDAEADRREEKGGKAKAASYFFSLDKFAVSEGIAQEDIYVVDGEHVGGPTRFINHSCDPNCRQYVVSFNKYDRAVYELAFFATEDIPAGKELCFDYMDSEGTNDGEGAEEEQAEEPTEERTRSRRPCLCGAPNCRGYIWM